MISMALRSVTIRDQSVFVPPLRNARGEKVSATQVTHLPTYQVIDDEEGGVEELNLANFGIRCNLSDFKPMFSYRLLVLNLAGNDGMEGVIWVCLITIP